MLLTDRIPGMAAENPINQGATESQATRMQRLGYFLAGIGVVLIGRALIVNNDGDFIREIEVVGGILSLASSLLSLKQAGFMKAEIQTRRLTAFVGRHIVNPYEPGNTPGE